MDEAWVRAVEAALEGQDDSAAAPRTLTLDGAVKCLHGRLPPPGLLERFEALEHLSIANVGVSSLENFPRMRNLQRLILSDNRIAGGLEFLVRAGLESLRDLDLSNNRIQFLEDLAPLAQLRLVSLDLYECPVTRIKDYRSRVFGMIRSLKYLDKMDADENERPETDDEEEDDEDEEEEEDDPGSGEVDGEDRTGKTINGAGRCTEREGVLDVDEDESDADEEEIETGARPEANGSGRDSHHLANGFQMTASISGHREDEESEDSEEEEYIEDYDDEEDLGEEINEEEGGDEDALEVHEIDDSEEEDGVEEDDEDEDDEDLEEEDVEDDGEDPGSTGRLTSITEGEIDGHEQGEEDENGEIGEEEEGVEDERESEDEDGEDEEEDDYLVQPIEQAENEAGGSDLDAGNEDNSEQEEVDDDEEGQGYGVSSHPSSSQSNKRRRDEDDLDDDDDDGGGGGVRDSKLYKHP